MTQDEQHIWEKVKTSLMTRIPQSEFDIWFSQTTLQKFDPDQTVIKAPNKFVAEWVRERYHTHLKNSFKAVLNQKPELLYSYNHPSGTTKSLVPRLTKSDKRPKHALDSSMTFKRFLVGDSNRFAWLSALEVSNGPGDQYNPLYLFSKQGLGKTHLLNAIGHHVLQKNPVYDIRYVPSNTFASDFTSSVRRGTFNDFKQSYNDIDVLLFDDIHLLSQRKKTQEKFLLLFNSLHSAKKQIVISGDRPPNQIKNADSRLISRLGWGLISEIKAPDRKTKVKIIKNKAKEDNIDIPDDVIFYLSKSHTDIKSLIQTIIRIEAYVSLNHRNINISTVKSFLKNHNMKSMGIEDIKSITAGYFNITLPQLISNKKQRIYSYPRQLAIYLSRKYTDLSCYEIGNSFGKKDHSTVIYAVKRIKNEKEKSKEIANDIRRIENLLG
jgi:chromosomal replication initiator protein